MAKGETVHPRLRGNNLVTKNGYPEGSCVIPKKATYMDDVGPAPCKRGNFGPWSAPVARVHPQIVQKHNNLPDLGSYRVLAMRENE